MSKHITVVSTNVSVPGSYELEVDNKRIFHPAHSPYTNLNDAIAAAKNLRVRFPDHSVRVDCTVENSLEEEAKLQALKQLGALKT